MQAFNLREHYSVLQALDEVGRALHGDDWTGMEPWAVPSDDPAEREREKTSAIQRVRDAQAEVDAAQRDGDFAETEEARNKAKERYLTAYGKLKVEQGLLNTFPYSFDGWRVSRELSKRLESAERELFLAFSTRKVRLLYKRDNEVPWDAWINQKGFKLYTNLSTIREPHYIRSDPVVSDDRNPSVTVENPRREPFRHAVFVRKDEFELWLYRQEWAQEAFKLLDTRAQCRLLLHILSLFVPEGKKCRREECETYCRNRVPDLSVNQFDDTWREPEFDRIRFERRPRENESFHIPSDILNGKAWFS